MEEARLASATLLQTKLYRATRLASLSSSFPS